MTRRRWIALLVVFLALLTCCCVVAAGSAGFLLGRAVRDSALSPDLLPPGSPPPTPQIVRDPPTAADRETLRLLGEIVPPPRDLPELAYELGRAPERVSVTPPPAPPSRTLGQTQTFWIHDQENATYFTATATLAYVTSHAYWWLEDGFDVPEEDIQASALRFEEQTYPTNRRIFGNESSPGIDGDIHIYIFLGNVPGVGGYFSSPDAYPAQISPYSNEHDIFYINLDAFRPGSSSFDGALAHEFQHMIHWTVDRNEDTWVNEGLSELAMQLNGYGTGSSGWIFSRRPDTQLNTWSDDDLNSLHYGASYLFMAYFFDRYGEEAVRLLATDPANGLTAFDHVLAAVDAPELRFDDLFSDWVIANYLDDPRLGNGEYGYTTLNPPQPRYAARHEEFPIYAESTVHQYAADYIPVEGKGDLTVEFTGSLQVPLVGNNVRSGQYQWWSGRADDSVSSLTRALDLTHTASATLRTWMWFHLEKDYDYAYVQVSTDGGDTWHILANDHTTLSNPAGSSYGPAFTGMSGGGEEPSWVEEVFDLSPYAGRTVLLRFQIIHDDAVNYPGFCLDDISIPEIGFSDDAESDAMGWQAEGWARVTANIPQAFSVQLITIGRTTEVLPLPLDPSLHGAITIERLGRDVRRVVLVVAGITPITTEYASYRYRLSLR